MTKATAPRTAHLYSDGTLLTKDERIKRLVRLKVWHKKTVDLMERFDFYERLSANALEGMHIAFPGRPGVGKSLLLKKIRNKILEREARAAGYTIQGTAIQAPWGDWRPVLRVVTPHKVTTPNFADNILFSLGAEDHFGNEGPKTRLIKRKLGEQRVRWILLDEFQRLTDHRTEKFAYLAGDWLKDVLNEEEAREKFEGYPGFVHAALFGTQSMAPLFLGNGQFARRSKGSFPFEPHDWIDPTDRALFFDTLDKFDEMLPFPERSLADTITKFHIHRATDAIISRVATLAQVAGLKAIDLDLPFITAQLFEETFDELAWELGSSDYHPRQNPWRDKGHSPGFMKAPIQDVTRRTRVRGSASTAKPDFSKT